MFFLEIITSYNMFHEILFFFPVLIMSREISLTHSIYRLLGKSLNIEYLMKNIK